MNKLVIHILQCTQEKCLGKYRDGYTGCEGHLLLSILNACIVLYVIQNVQTTY